MYNHEKTTQHLLDCRSYLPHTVVEMAKERWTSWFNTILHTNTSLFKPKHKPNTVHLDVFYFKPIELSMIVMSMSQDIICKNFEKRGITLEFIYMDK